MLSRTSYFKPELFHLRSPIDCALLVLQRTQGRFLAVQPKQVSGIRRETMSSFHILRPIGRSLLAIWVKA